MSELLLLCALILFSCVFANVFLGKYGMPTLLLFMGVGMLFGPDGLLKIQFQDYDLMEKLSTIALTFIIFYGGFCTKWKTAKPIAIQATLLSTLGVVITALLTCAFCYYCLNIGFAESFIIGAVISSTDAASVFSILRSKNLNLKNSTAPLLELESGSNDPFAYLLTVIGIALLTGETTKHIPEIFVKQIVFGILGGIIISYISVQIFKKTKTVTSSFYPIFMIGIVLISFALPDMLGGNGLLSVYITGIVLGNAQIKHTSAMVNFFDGLTSLAQLLIFFLLGLSAYPHKIAHILIPASAIAVFLTFVARPVAVFGILLPMKSNFNQCALVSWAGLRGAASIVFAVLVTSVAQTPKHDLFHIVFLIALLSVAIQGTMLPYIAKKFNMIDENSDVRKTFNDYQEQEAISLIQMSIDENHAWSGKSLKNITLPEDTLALMVKRGEEKIIPKGNTVLKSGDFLILSVSAYQSNEEVNLEEVVITKKHIWKDKHISEIDLPENTLIAMINRNDKNVVPRGKTKLIENDTLVLFKQEDMTKA
ncbi:MAG: potassium/proton antiporter [Cyanobacteria bacterium SIG30]|nr:potassium/proton antiporter [Cyanobacteria bacterium SIG30]